MPTAADQPGFTFGLRFPTVPAEEPFGQEQLFPAPSLAFQGPFPVPEIIVPGVGAGAITEAAAIARGASLGVGGLVVAGVVITAAKIFEELQNQEIDELIRGQENAIAKRLAKKRVEKTLRTTVLRTPESRVVATRAESDAAKIQGLLQTKIERGRVEFERSQEQAAFERSLEPVAAGSTIGARPPTGRGPAEISDLPQFPFEDPFESPLGDDPLLAPPGTPMVVVPVPDIEIPAPEPVSKPETRPAPTPTPIPAPGTRTPPGTRPGTPTSPFTFPFSLPIASPFASPRPALRPTPLTPVGPGRVDLPDLVEDPTFTLTPQPFGQVPTQTSECPPCTKEDVEEEPRTECFKKLVKERVLPSQDESFDWVEIDCFTGREL